MFRKEHRVIKCPELEKYVRLTLTYQRVPVVGGGIADDLVKVSCALLNELLLEGKNCGRSCKVGQDS